MNETPAGIPHEQLAALSHEFRTPLNGVIGMARLLAATRLTAEQRAYVKALSESGEHLLGLVNDVLDYSRLGAGKVELALCAVAPDDMLRQVCELLSPRAHEKNLEIGWGVGGDVAPIVADEGRMRQILLNLAGNAVKFVSSGGVMMLAERRGRNRLRITVSDTGPGVPKAERRRIFEAFAQGSSGRAARQPGAGLGLAIAGGLAKAMGGRLGLAAAADGGAAFWFEAPFATEACAAKARPLLGRTVAVASPSPVVRLAALRQIEANGGAGIAATSVAEAVERSPREAVVLVDHLLADAGTAPEPARGRASVILLRPGERDRIDPYRRGGFAGYLIKPLRQASLVERVLAAGARPGSDDDRVAPADAKRAPAAGGARVLLAEDNPINAMLAGALLKREGAEVAHVSTGEAALEEAAAGAYDLVLMDVRMPGLGGLEAARMLRARGVATPIVALTADAFDDARRACLEAGMDDFLVKPLSPEALRLALGRWTSRPAATDRSLAADRPR